MQLPHREMLTMMQLYRLWDAHPVWPPHADAERIAPSVATTAFWVLFLLVQYFFTVSCPAQLAQLEQHEQLGRVRVVQSIRRTICYPRD